MQDFEGERKNVARHTALYARLPQFDGVSMKPFAEKFYRSRIWRSCRAAYLTSRFGLCERCGAAGKIVHHRIELTPANISDASFTLGWDNLELCCQACHNQEHHGGVVVGIGLMFDDEGDLVEFE